MSETKHTAGPWQVITGVKCAGEPSACVVTGRDAVAVFAADEAVARANAALIAAALDLLAMLKTARSRIHSDICSEDCCDECVEATREIARAEVSS